MAHLLRVWGQGSEAIAMRFPPDAREEDGVYCYWFSSTEERQQRARQMRSCAEEGDRVIATAQYDGPDAESFLYADIELRTPDGKRYAFAFPFGYGYPGEAAEYMWHDGNYACDDNRSAFIQRYCDPDFPDYDDCGETITLEKFELRRVPRFPN